MAPSTSDANFSEIPPLPVSASRDHSNSPTTSDMMFRGQNHAGPCPSVPYSSSTSRRSTGKQASFWGSIPPSGALRLIKNFAMLLAAVVVVLNMTGAVPFSGHAADYDVAYDPFRQQRLLRSEQILVSFVVPCYEQLDTLQRTLDSVTNQPGFPYYEIIVINDGSPNGADFDKFAKLYAADKPAGVDHVHILGELDAPVKPKKVQQRAVYFVSKRNGGLSSARNFAIEMASGVWIMPLDSDDLIAPTFFEAILRELAKNNLDMWEPGPYNVISPGIATLDGRAYPDQPVGIETIDLRKGNGIPYASMYRRSLPSLHGIKYRSVMAWGWEDWDFWTQAHDKVGLKVLYVREPIFLYSSLGAFEKEEHMASFCEDRTSFCQSIFLVANARLYPDHMLKAALDVLTSRQDLDNAISAGRAKKAQWEHLMRETQKPDPDPHAMFLRALAFLREDRVASLKLLGQVMAMGCDANGVDRLAHMLFRRVTTASEITRILKTSRPPKPATKCENVLFSRILLSDKKFSAASGWVSGASEEVSTS